MSSSDRSGVRPKLGYVLKRFPRLSETFILNELLELERQGVEIEIYSLKRPTDEPRHILLDKLKASVTYVAGRAIDDETREAERPELTETLARLTPAKSVPLRLALERKARAIGMLARSHGVTHLHAHFLSDATTAAMLASRVAGVRFSFTAHARDIFHCYSTPEADDDARRAKIAAANFVATVSDYNRRHLAALAGLAGQSKVVRLYNGIDLNSFAPSGDSDPTGVSILSVGRLIEKKGFSDLIDACALLADRGTSFSCEIIGDGPLQLELGKRIGALGLADKVVLRGALPQHEVLAAMRRARVLVLPCVKSTTGDQDGLPTVLLEALAVGLPAISTNLAGIPEIIEPGVSGLLVEPGAPGELANAITRILASPELARRLAAGGRERALDRFDLKRNVAQLRRHFVRATSEDKGDERADCLSLV